MDIRFAVFKKTAEAGREIRIVTTPGKWSLAGV
jgi:hypothetical protein